MEEVSELSVVRNYPLQSWSLLEQGGERVVRVLVLYSYTGAGGGEYNAFIFSDNPNTGKI